MEPLLARKIRLSLVVEPLEDRRLLSQFGQSSGWGDSAHQMMSQGPMAPPIWGPMVAPRDHASSPGPGPGDVHSSQPFTQQNADPSAEDTPASNCPTNSPPTMSVGNANAPAPGPGPAAGLDPVGNTPNAGGLASTAPPAVSSQLIERVLTSDNTAGISPGGDSHGSVGGLTLNALSVALVATPPSRGPSPGPIARSNGDFTQTARVEPASAIGPESVGHAGPDESLLSAVVSVPGTSAIAFDTSAHGSTTIGVLNGRGLIDGQGRSSPDVGASKAAPDPQGPADTPDGSDWDSEGTGAEAGVGNTNLTSTPPEGVSGVPDPHLADMIMSLMPFDRSTMDRAIDQFLEPFDGLTSSMPELRGPLGVVTASLTVAVTVLAVDVAIRLRRSKDEEIGADSMEGLAPFPGL